MKGAALLASPPGFRADFAVGGESFRDFGDSMQADSSDGWHIDVAVDFGAYLHEETPDDPLVRYFVGDINFADAAVVLNVGCRSEDVSMELVALSAANLADGEWACVIDGAGVVWPATAVDRDLLQL